MLSKILIALAVILGVFIIFVATRPSHFHYERSDLIHAPAEKIFPYLSQFHKGNEWSPYEQKDPTMKITIEEPDGQIGSRMSFESKNAGRGNLEILKLNPNELVELRLTMTEPIQGVNIVHYKLVPEADGTRFIWSMEGESGFFGKLFAVFVDCEKMMADDFSLGIQNLKTLIEAQK